MALLLVLSVGGVFVVLAASRGSKPDRIVLPDISAAVASAPAPKAVSFVDALDWTKLGEPQRALLHPLQAAWPGLDSVNRQRWLEVAKRVRRLSPKALERVQARMADWAKMPPKKRAQARLQYVYAKRIPAAKRNELWGKYQVSPAASAAHGEHDAGLTMVSPALAQVRPGATTVPVTQLLRPATVEVEESPREPG